MAPTRPILAPMPLPAGWIQHPDHAAFAYREGASEVRQIADLLHPEDVPYGFQDESDLLPLTVVDPGADDVARPRGRKAKRVEAPSTPFQVRSGTPHQPTRGFRYTDSTGSKIGRMIPGLKPGSRHVLFVRTATEQGERFRQSLQEQHGRYIHDYPKKVRGLESWSWFCTNTFERKVSESRAKRAFAEWLERISSKDHLDAAFAIERTSSGLLHIHSLLLFYPRATRPPIKWAGARWKNGGDRAAGFTKIVDFDPDRRGAWYVSKTGTYDLYTHCPRPPRCRRGNGVCKERSCGLWL